MNIQNIRLKSKSSFLFGVVILLVVSCVSTPKNAIVSTAITESFLPALVLENPVQMSYDTISELASGRLELPVDKFGLYQLQAGRASRYLYVEPGKEVMINWNDREGLEIAGDLSEEHELLKEFDKQLSIANSKYHLGSISNIGAEAFELKLEEKYQGLNDLLSSAQEKNIPESLINLLNDRITADKAITIHLYPAYYRDLTKEETTLSEALSSQIEDFKNINPLAFNFQDVKYAAMAFISQATSSVGNDNTQVYMQAQLEEAEAFAPNNQVKELLQFSIISDYINFGGGITDMKGIIKDFVSSANDPVRIQLLEQTVKKWEHLEKGAQAYDFVGESPEGREVSLKDFEGKNVYIDVWATWCGPCIMEIPALKEREEEYKDANVVFMSVSVDQEKDREKWRAMIENKDLGGVQIMLDQQWSQKMSQFYNIESIPRFLLIDQSGSIADANAPRPSNKAAFEQMMAEVLN